MLQVLPVLRAGASCRYRLRLGPQPTHMNTGSTLERPLRLRVRACRANVPMSTTAVCHPCSSVAEQCALFVVSRFSR